MKMMKWATSGLAVLAAVFLLTSCNNNSDGVQPSSRLEVYLTDAPGAYQAVWIDIQAIEVRYSSKTDSAGEENGVAIPVIRPGLYNLLDFRNGKDTILAAVDLPAGEVSQIRLILGDNNSIVLKDGTQIPLKTPSAQQSGLKLNIHAELESGIPYALVLDFDAARSIVKAGNSGKYILKPVIRTFAKAAGGAIEGVVMPSEAQAQVLAIQNEDTLGAIPNTEGEYKFWGLPVGDYKLIFVPDTTSGYVADTLENVAVQVGEVTKVDTVTLVRN